MEYRTAKKVSNVLSMVGVVFLLSLFLFTESPLFNTIALIVSIIAICSFAASVIVFVMFYKCPHCHSRIRAWGLGVPDYCPSCGEAL